MRRLLALFAKLAVLAERNLETFSVMSFLARVGSCKGGRADTCNCLRHNNCYYDSGGLPIESLRDQLRRR